MSSEAKVVAIGSRRRRVKPRSERPAAMKARIRSLEEELARLKPEAEREGLIVALARALEEGGGSLGWEPLAKAWKAVYFSVHSKEVDDFGLDRKYLDSVRPLLEFLYAVWWRVETFGIEHVPADGPALIVANHSGVLPYDGLMVNLAVRHEHPARRECRMLALDMFALLPFLAPALARGGAVRASQENGERLLRAGELVGVFPEGVKGVGKRFAQRYKLARFGRGGFVRLALRTGAPIVPCAVVGAEEIHPMIGQADWVGKPLGLPYFPLTPTFPWLGPLGFVPLPTKWSIDFADPLPTEKYGPEAADDLILVHRLAEDVRQTIQRMIDGRLRRRRSVWFG